jgi:hypothetical protein
MSSGTRTDEPTRVARCDTSRKSAVRRVAAVVFVSVLALSAYPLVAWATGTGQTGAEAQGQSPATSGGSSNQSGSMGQPPSGGMGGGADTQSYDYRGIYQGTLSADGVEQTSSSETLAASDADVNAALVQNGGSLAIYGDTLTKSGDDTNGDNCNFYGVNSVATAVGEGSALRIADSTLSSTSEGSNGVFSTDGATACVTNSTIETSAGNSRGLDATYGGTIVADGLSISTNGDHCAAVATDRGGGDVSVASSKFATAGSGSPLIYSTGTIEVDGVEGTATGSQIAGMEGLNTIRIANSTLESTVTDKTASDPVADGVIIYQSTSGDADTSAGEAARFEALDSKLSSSIQSGSMFYITNTTADVVLENTTLDFDASKANLLLVEGNSSNSWGSAGSNGGTVNFTCLGEDVSGNVTVDTISSLGLYLLDGTTYTGAVSIEENANGSTVDDPVTVNVSSDSTWVVTDDSTVSNLNVKSGGKVVDADGKSVTIVAGGQTVVQGESGLTVTVTGSYGTDFTTDDANATSDMTIDRSVLDESTDSSGTSGSDTQGGPFDGVIQWFKRLFG